ncbi:hypothetical protein GCM10018793_02290 [Streptomyces sulfonofaciens]|uniref:Maleylpyruvate isomerase family mycothiol-dependent enzyme n=1 Tax=Streptomyces sulfonofaciens TaxID=68272 RepID=A0A919FNQ7_9ACTN|nr:hypothetical protein GCM10018793_02290 [Streptomyces sulfonofaciens]
MKTRAAVRAQFGHVRDAVRGLTEEQLAGPTRLGEWTVRDLAAHLTLAPNAIVRALDGPEPAKQETGATDWALGTSARAEAVDEGTRAFAAAHPDLDALYEDTAARFAERMAAAGAERLVDTNAGAMNLTDYLVTRIVELVVHTDDLACATGLDIAVDRRALAAATRLLADALAAKAPGASTEVRVPPFAVVQCIAGPRHTRGTPPNVVETDPLTWIRLATGRARWRTEVAEARVGASGERADLEALLPVMS